MNRKQRLKIILIAFIFLLIPIYRPIINRNFCSCPSFSPPPIVNELGEKIELPKETCVCPPAYVFAFRPILMITKYYQKFPDLYEQNIQNVTRNLILTFIPHMLLYIFVALKIVKKNP
jgi:hypothetical protein